jgi:hypothetical protein
MDTVQLSTGGRNSGILLSLYSAEVGNGNPNESGTLQMQDGGLAIRLQLLSNPFAFTGVGPISRTDDEGITFTATQFEDSIRVSDRSVFSDFTANFVILGTAGDDTLPPRRETRVPPTSTADSATTP